MNNNNNHIINDFKVTHNIPNLTLDEIEIIKKDILRKIYNLFTEQDVCIDTKVKQHI